MSFAADFDSHVFMVATLGGGFEFRTALGFMYFSDLDIISWLLTQG
jgi:hypothetical protein